jgi:hypothetical protein
MWIFLIKEIFLFINLKFFFINLKKITIKSLITTDTLLKNFKKKKKKKKKLRYFLLFKIYKNFNLKL